MPDLDEFIKDNLFGVNNKKINVNETLDEYLESFKRQDLVAFAIPNSLINKNYFEIYKLRRYNNKPKKNIINYIKDNLNDIVSSYMKVINSRDLDLFETVINNNGKEFKIGDIDISFHFIIFLKNFSLAKVEYNKAKDSLKIFMPKEYINVLKKALKDKKTLEINKYNTKVFDYCITVINTYGIVPLSKLVELFNRQMFKIDEDEIFDILQIMSIYDEVCFYHDNDDILLANMDLHDEDEALDFYENQKGNYKDYSKEEFQKISDGTYMRELKSYKALINYLIINFEIETEEDVEYIDDLLINDYLMVAQTSKELADRSFKDKLIDMFELNNDEIKHLLSLMQNIFKEYPKWIKRGKI